MTGCDPTPVVEKWALGQVFSPSRWTFSLSVPSHYFFVVFNIHVLAFLEGQKTKLGVFPEINTGLEN